MISLRTDLINNAVTAHKLLAGLPENRQVLLGQQEAISGAFVAALKTFPASRNTTALLAEADRSWQEALTIAGLWGTQVNTYQGIHNARQVEFEINSDEAPAILNGLQKPSLDAMQKGLANGADYEWALMVALALLLGSALAVTVYFRRRMTKDLVRPVANLHEGVLKLQAGDYGHPIEVVRLDELGELAHAFNEPGAE